jgi:hypothetical protein
MTPRFANEVWDQLGPEARELIRSLSIEVDRLETGERAKIIGACLWLTWLGGYYDHLHGRRNFWGYELPPDAPPVPGTPHPSTGAARKRKGTGKATPGAKG